MYGFSGEEYKGDEFVEFGGEDCEIEDLLIYLLEGIMFWFYCWNFSW